MRSAPGARSLKRTLLTTPPLAIADALALGRGNRGERSGLVAGRSGRSGAFVAALVLEASLVCAFVMLGLYPGVGLNPVVELRQLVCGTTLTFGVFWAATRTQHVFGAQAQLLLWLTWPLAIVAIPLARAAVRCFCGRCSWWGQRVLVFGGGRSGLAIYQHLRARPWLGLRPVGIVDDDAAAEGARGHRCYLGSPSEAAAIAEQEGVAWAVVAMPERSRDDISRVIQNYAADFPCLLVVPDIEGLATLWTSAHDCGGIPALRVQERLLLPLPRITKRCMDLMLIVLAAAGLVADYGAGGAVDQTRFGRADLLQPGASRDAGAPLSSLEVPLDGDRRPATLARVFGQRSGAAAEWELTQKLRHDPRVTRVGRLLRKTSLDELPQLWNVLRREMSLVGPRPIVEDEIPKYSHYYDLYTKVSPGISGLWQVSGRNNTTYQQRVEFDAFYCRNWSVWLDVFILIRTIKVVLMREGAY